MDGRQKGSELRPRLHELWISLFPDGWRLWGECSAAMADGATSNDSGDGRTLTQEALQLFELFPDIPLLHINHVLKVSQNDTFAASEQLLAYDLIKDNLDQYCQQDVFEEKKPQEWVMIEPPAHSTVSKHTSKSKKKSKGNVKQKKQQNDKDFRRRPSESSQSTEMSTNGSDFSTVSSAFTDLSTSTSVISSTVDGAMEAMKIRRLAEMFEMEETVMELLEISPEDIELVKYYLERNHYQKLSSVYDIMLNFDSTLPMSYQTHHQPENVVFSPHWNPNAIQDNSTVTMSDMIKLGMKNIRVAENDSCWEELQSLIDSNPQLELPKVFYMVAINWFNKDVYKVINLAIILNDCFDEKDRREGELQRQRDREKEKRRHLEQYLITDDIDGVRKELKGLSLSDPADDFNYIHDKGSHKSGDFKEVQNSKLNDMTWRAKRLKHTLNSTNDKSLRAYYTSSIASAQAEVKNLHEDLQAHEVEKRINQAKTNFRIDLHQMSVKNALYAIETLTSYWWDYEMEQRNVHNTKFEFSKACHVEPLTIITGRGLHSGGGIAKIKRAAVRFLNDNSYKFEENFSTLIIFGRRKS